MEIEYTTEELELIKLHLENHAEELDRLSIYAAQIQSKSKLSELTLQQLEIQSIVDKTNLIIESRK